MNIIKRMTSITQDRFRKELIKRDQFCILSGLCHEVCDAAHLVNKEYIKTSSKTLMFTPDNGILLNSNLHKEFDMNFWTIDMNSENWDKIKKTLDPNKLTYKCDIKLYPVGEKKLKTNLNVGIFKYLETGIEVPIECMPFIILRNEIEKNKKISNQFTIEDIEKGLKIDFKPNKKKRKRTKKSPEKTKKRTRYTSDQQKIISNWVDTLATAPNKTERTEFCERSGLNTKTFETRFAKLWKKYKQ